MAVAVGLPQRRMTVGAGQASIENCADNPRFDADPVDMDPAGSCNSYVDALGKLLDRDIRIIARGLIDTGLYYRPEVEDWNHG